MKKNLAILLLPFFLLTGCGGLRFAPSELQKQNAWLHNRTTAVAANTAASEDASKELQALTKLSELQSRVFTSYYGLPKVYPPADNAEEILAQSNFQLSQKALGESSARPDIWELADNAFELGIGIFALLGGVYGTKTVQFLKQTRTKSKALQEIIAGNELFKKENNELATAFKQAQKDQSPQTRQIVASMKS